MSTSPQPPSNPPHRTRWSSEDCIRIFVMFPLVIFVIGFTCSDYFSDHSPQHSAAPIVSDVFRFPERFVWEYELVERDLKVYIYQDRDPGAYFQSPRKLTGKYGSEGYFFKNIKESRFLTTDPLHARLFFIPISWHQMRTLRTPYENMTVIVEKYVERLISKYPYWNRTQGADHFFVICHDNGVEVAEGVPLLKKNPIRLVCPASYDSYYTSYKDISLPQVNQPFSPATVNRTKSGFWGSIPNFEIIAAIQSNLTDSAEGYLLYHDKVHRTKFCICLPGFPDYTNLIADSIRYGCVPVIFSSYLNYTFNDILDWHKFSIILAEDHYLIKDTLRGIRAADFTGLQKNLLKVQKHFQWNSPPLRFDAFNMVMFDLWQHSSEV
ncbi:probable glycosyltransferase At5g03795 [Corylus avellana]|uniref:probable glycosyltransferase At5g03795 n=1 Tax=Corylus avellana TaxID=13451 RepID=UPI001E219EBA|nr:probable glycosyltransferase At5g03795 [Corylus avellana]